MHNVHLYSSLSSIFNESLNQSIYLFSNIKAAQDDKFYDNMMTEFLVLNNSKKISKMMHFRYLKSMIILTVRTHGQQPLKTDFTVRARMVEPVGYCHSPCANLSVN